MLGDDEPDQKRDAQHQQDCYGDPDVVPRGQLLLGGLCRAICLAELGDARGATAETLAVADVGLD
jgi:hypothetical protein